MQVVIQCPCGNTYFLTPLSRAGETGDSLVTQCPVCGVPAGVLKKRIDQAQPDEPVTGYYTRAKGWDPLA